MCVSQIKRAFNISAMALQIFTNRSPTEANGDGLEVLAASHNAHRGLHIAIALILRGQVLMHAWKVIS